MPRPALLSLVLAAALAAGLALMPAGAAVDDDVQPVIVTNFPETQRVEGRVAIAEPVPQAALASILEVEVPPTVSTGDPRRLVSAGVLDTDGFGAVVISLAGQAKGHLHQPGEVGVILVPDQEGILAALEEKGRLLFPLETRAPVASGVDYFSSPQTRFVVAFPRYRVLLFNTTGRTVTTDLYAYLTM
ncbi:MAG TPA: hypothetical protein VJV23_14810 [Candidatus Polarisedimenticolia bacterium]|nr:hypothetical protein [Candidatus Polarisedimenticolia bacterium]